MTPKQQRIAIAEACGWKDVEFGVGPNSNLCLGDKPSCHGKVQSYLVDQRVPDYPNSLDAMHEAVRKLPDGYTYWKYIELLDGLVKHGEHVDYIADRANATAAQHAKAFLHAMNLWTED